MASASLLWPCQGPLDRLHDEYFAVVPSTAKNLQLVQIQFESLLVNGRAILFAMIITTQPSGHRSWLADFATDKLSASDLRNFNRNLGLNQRSGKKCENKS
jgi:hypothetical protein